MSKKKLLYGLIPIALMFGILYYNISKKQERAIQTIETPVEALPTQTTRGLHFTYLFEKGPIKCKIEYTLTGMLPIIIKRTYQDGKTEFLILKKIKPDHAKEVYQLANQSKDHLNAFQPGVFDNLGKSEQETRQHIFLINKLSDQYNNLKLGVFLINKNNPKQKFIGQVSEQCNGYYKKNSADGCYWLGLPELTGIKGAGKDAIQALFNHLIYIGKAKHLNLVIHPSNTKSKKIAEKLQMKRINPETYKKWGYREKQSWALAYSLSAKEWQKKHWGKHCKRIT